MYHVKNLLGIINPMTWSLRRILFVGSLIWMGVAMLAIEPIVQMTILKKFYQNVALADKYSDELTFDHLIVKTQSSEGVGSGSGYRRAGIHFKNCSQAFRNVETGKGGAFTCSRNFMSYYGVDDINMRALVTAKEKMAVLGWNEVGNDYGIESQLRSIQNQADGTVRDVSYKHGDNINASILFLTRGSEDYHAFCRDLRIGCSPFEKANESQKNIMIVNISAYKWYDE